MHLLILLSGLGVSWGLRYFWTVDTSADWSERWQQGLKGLLFAPLLMLTSAIAVIWMGPQGQMVWLWEGWLSYVLAIGFLSLAAVCWLHLIWQGQRTLQQIRAYPQTELLGRSVRVLDLAMPYSAQVGFWQPELVVSQGLLDKLDYPHLEAVLLHEQAHHYYRDTFWFFWLGWARRLTAWLPQSDSVWQELLVLRELRADRWVAEQTDALLLAEALLLVVSTPPILDQNICAAFSSVAPPSRLMQRIEALFTDAAPQRHLQTNLWSWGWLLLVWLPLLSIPFHS
ncbi:MAG: M56 family metallopeptidase [Aphanocapsa sp. GSE-SYN-MK-11-07L]|jgi:Zn-dependent protease with chaperone function|nr:M56 family metallopeptidase [Aphanocapsa sp. GSE-SYN-MK-11-07L]